MKWVTEKRVLVFALLSVTALTITVYGTLKPEKMDSAKSARMAQMYREIHEKFKDVPDVTVSQYLQWRKTQPRSIVLVDVRDDHERAISTIPGAISIYQFKKKKDYYRNRKVIVYCTIGYRSSVFARTLMKADFVAYNLKGSAIAWAHAGELFQTPQGEKTRRLHVYGKPWDLLPNGYQAIY